MCKTTTHRYMLDDVGQARSWKDCNHFEMVSITKEGSEMFVDLPRTYHRKRMAIRSEEIQSLQTPEDSYYIW